MKRFSILAATVLLAGCSSPDQQAQWAGEKTVSAALKDPSSARFSGEFVVRKPVDASGSQDIAICGVVNGKNSFGAYTGGSRFVVSQSENKKLNTFDTVYVAIEDDDGRRATAATVESPQLTSIFEDGHWNKECVDAAHPATHTGDTSWLHH